jgi:hypothetical protein
VHGYEIGEESPLRLRHVVPQDPGVGWSGSHVPHLKDETDHVPVVHVHVSKADEITQLVDGHHPSWRLRIFQYPFLTMMGETPMSGWKTLILWESVP